MFLLIFPMFLLLVPMFLLIFPCFLLFFPMFLLLFPLFLLIFPCFFDFSNVFVAFSIVFGDFSHVYFTNVFLIFSTVFLHVSNVFMDSSYDPVRWKLVWLIMIWSTSKGFHVRKIWYDHDLIQFEGLPFREKFLNRKFAAIMIWSSFDPVRRASISGTISKHQTLLW